MHLFTINGQPIPKARPRVVTRNGRSHTHTPGNTVAWEQTVGWSALAQGVRCMEGDLAVVLHFRRKGKRRADLDNLVKAVTDGLNGIAYRDDTQIVALSATVVYNAKAPGVDVVIKEAA